MQTITFYILPITEIQVTEKSTLELRKIRDQIKKNSDIIQLTQEFSTPDANGKTWYDKIYQQEMNSTTKFFIQILNGLKSALTPIATINCSDYHNQFIKIDDNHGLNEEFIICTMEDLINYYQRSALQLQNFPELFDWKKNAFHHYSSPRILSGPITKRSLMTTPLYSNLFMNKPYIVYLF